MAMGSAEFVLDMILMKQMAGITNFQAMSEPSGLDGDSTGSSATSLALEEPGAAQGEAARVPKRPKAGFSENCTLVGISRDFGT